MAAHRAVELKVAILLVAMLLALGSWRGSVVYAQSTQDFPHFKCYVITPKPSANEPVTLVDQFGTEDVVRRGAEFVCTPVLEKNGVALLQPLPPFDHLKCHNITPSGPPINETFTVTDQFGPENLTFRTAQFLCAPATKEEHQ